MAVCDARKVASWTGSPWFAIFLSGPTIGTSSPQYGGSWDDVAPFQVRRKVEWFAFLALSLFLSLLFSLVGGLQPELTGWSFSSSLCRFRESWETGQMFVREQRVSTDTATSLVPTLRYRCSSRYTILMFVKIFKCTVHRLKTDIYLSSYPCRHDRTWTIVFSRFLDQSGREVGFFHNDIYILKRINELTM